MSRRYENRHLGQSHNSFLPRVAGVSLLAFFFQVASISPTISFTSEKPDSGGYGLSHALLLHASSPTR